MFKTEIKVDGKFVKGTIRKTGTLSFRFYGNVLSEGVGQRMSGLGAIELENMIDELMQIRDKVKGVN